jgi:hypothetical protein
MLDEDGCAPRSQPEVPRHQYFVGIEGGLRSGERVGGSGGWLAINEGQGIGSYTKPLEVRSRKLLA